MASAWTSEWSLRDLLICDLDGTLVDSAPDLAAALGALLAEEGLQPVPLAEVRLMVGEGAAKLVQRGFRASGRQLSPEALAPLVERFLELYGRRLCVESLLYEGAEKVLAGLRRDGWRLAVCTNKAESLSRRLLAALQVAPYFEAVAGGDSFPTRKPHPDHLLLLLRRLGVPPERAVMLGDSVNDVQAAKGAGIPCIAVTFGYSRLAASSLGADLLMSHFHQLPGLLRQLAAGLQPDPQA